MRIEIVDDRSSFRASLLAALETQSSLNVEIESGRRPDIIITGHIQGHDSTEFLKLAEKTFPEIPVLIIVEQLQAGDIRHVLMMGAAGILFQETAAHHISWAIPAILNGCRALSPEVSESMIGEYLDSASMTPQEKSARENVNRLSGREQEVLQLLGHGMSNREIATSLSISPETVKDHVRSIRSKLNVANRVHAAHVAWLARGMTACAA
ncbi:response regulator transcription factor [Streptomyces sp. NPDC050548]|uniref:response regulator transcription factor n=1 Tax=Streptomyces sp. NPDC050548 TaxID=3365629 RepID=UPI0037BAFC7F